MCRGVDGAESADMPLRCASLDLVVDESAALARVAERVSVSAAAELPELVGPAVILLFVDEGGLSFAGDRIVR